MGALVMEDLNHNGKGFHHKEAANNKRNQFGLGHHRHATNGGAQGERTRVAHENVGGVRVVPQKADAGASEGATKDRSIEHVEAVGNHGHNNEHDHNRSRCQAVEAVGEVNGVAHARQQNGNKNDIEPWDVKAIDGRSKNAQVKRWQEGELNRRRYAEPIHCQQAEHDRNNKLDRQLRAW